MVIKKLKFKSKKSLQDKIMLKTKKNMKSFETKNNIFRLQKKDSPICRQFRISFGSLERLSRLSSPNSVSTKKKNVRLLKQLKYSEYIISGPSKKNNLLKKKRKKME